MSENVVNDVLFSPLYGAFFGITFICLLVATPRKRSVLARIILWAVGLLFLLLQGGCWVAASAFGKATGGGGVDNAWWWNTMAIAAFVFIIWSVIILIVGTSFSLENESPDKKDDVTKD